jgi:hypothetical protein
MAIAAGRMSRGGAPRKAGEIRKDGAALAAAIGVLLAHQEWAEA